MTRIVSHAHRYKRPPLKNPKAAALAGPAIAATKKSRRSVKRAATEVGLLNCPAIHDGAAQPSTPRDAERYITVTTQSDHPELRAWLSARNGARSVAMTARPVPKRHWRCDGDVPLPTGAEALDEPFSAFPSWFLRIECDRCGKLQMVNQAHMRWDNLPIRDIIARMRHDGCDGRAGRVEHRGRERRPGRCAVYAKPPRKAPKKRRRPA